MSTLEMLLKAEASLSDSTQPYDHNSWSKCTCGHIYHAVNGEYGYSARVQTARIGDPYRDVLQEIVNVLDLEEKIEHKVHHDGPYDLVSDYTEMVAARNGWEEGADIEREHALMVIQEAIAEIRKRDSLVIAKNAHDYEVKVA